MKQAQQCETVERFGLPALLAAHRPGLDSLGLKQIGSQGRS